MKDTKELFVLKNNKPSAVILSPEEYARLTEIEENYVLFLDAAERLEQDANRSTTSMETVMEELGITKEEVESAEDVVIE